MKPLPDNESVYKAHGYKDRKDYLNTLAEDRGIDYLSVKTIADTLGPNEDFDGLISALDAYEDLYGEE